jgi:hypothetical protein
VLPRETDDRVGDIWPGDQAMPAAQAEHLQAMISAGIASVPTLGN